MPGEFDTQTDAVEAHRGQGDTVHVFGMPSTDYVCTDKYPENAEVVLHVHVEDISGIVVCNDCGMTTGAPQA